MIDPGDVIRGLGWAVLKVVSLGRYTSAGSHAELFEGTIGLLVIAAAIWLSYQWLA
jgi:hypothetical protein